MVHTQWKQVQHKRLNDTFLIFHENRYLKIYSYPYSKIKYIYFILGYGIISAIILLVALFPSLVTVRGI